MRKHEPIRMCVACRMRDLQCNLLRLKQNDTGEIVTYDGKGRSIYLCDACIRSPKKIKGLIKRFKQNEERFVKLLKEFSHDGEN